MEPATMSRIGLAEWPGVKKYFNDSEEGLCLHIFILFYNLCMERILKLRLNNINYKVKCKMIK